jgi:hypothetical protein
MCTTPAPIAKCDRPGVSADSVVNRAVSDDFAMREDTTAPSHDRYDLVSDLSSEQSDKILPSMSPTSSGR